MSLPARVYTATVVVLGVSLLPGCWADPAREPSEWRARLHAGVLEVAACEPIRGSGWTGYVEQASGDRWRIFWEISGSIDVPAGDSMIGGATGFPDAAEIYRAALVSDGDVVALYLEDKDGRAGSASFELTAEDADVWIAPDGTKSSQACE